MPEQMASATLGGKPMLLSLPCSWRLTRGVQPSYGTFAMTPADALELDKKGGPFTLQMIPVEGNPVNVTNLWVLNVLPGPNPWISHVMVADRRWMWSYGHILLRMNMRRNVGVKRILANDKFAVNFDRAPQVAFAKYSLDQNEQRRFVALSMVQKLLQKVSEIEKDYHGDTFQAKIDERIGSKIKGLPVEELEIDDTGDQAVRRGLGYLPDADVTVDYDGTVVVYSRAGGDEDDIVRAVMPEIRDEGHTDLVKNSRLRPKKVRVYFTREVEVRFDYIEQAAARGQTIATGAEPLGELRRLDNVLPIPDYQLTVTEIDDQPLAQGTWITFDQGFRSWGSLPLVGTARYIDHDLVQQAFLPQMDMWAALQLAGNRPDGQGTLYNWVGRLAAIEGHYRTTFRINRRWMDRFLSIRDYRVATIDPQSGQRAPARAYGDYCILYSQRSIWRNHAQGKPLDFAINRSAFPSGGNFDSSAEPSPAVVDIIDHDQGIFHVDYRGTNPLSGDQRTILPSQISQDSMPCWDARQRTRPITFDSIINGAKPPRLSPSFRLAVILTAIPASPNDKSQLHMVEITPGDVRDLIPAEQQAGLSECEGPVMEIRVGPNVEVARIAWNDSRAADIEAIFGMKNGQPDPSAVANLDGLVINEGKDVAVESGASINHIARALAARVYASMVDRYEEEMLGAMNGGVHLAGNVSEITHEYSAKGTTTRVSFPPEIPQMNLLSFLDSSTRMALLKLVQPQ